jgi:hypothetical protein
MTRMPSLVLAFCGLLLLGSTAAFLLYVSLLSIVAVVLILTAAMFMFLLGVNVERRRRVLEIPSDKTLPQMQGTHTLLGARDRSITSMEARGRA